MIKHIVSWKVKEQAEGLSKAENVQKMNELLSALPEKIDVIQEFEIGIDFLQSERSYDICLISAFNTTEDLKSYAQHPDHLMVVDYFKKVVEKSVAVDYEL